MISLPSRRTLELAPDPEVLSELLDCCLELHNSEQTLGIPAHRNPSSGSADCRLFDELALPYLRISYCYLLIYQIRLCSKPLPALMGQNPESGLCPPSADWTLSSDWSGIGNHDSQRALTVPTAQRSRLGCCLMSIQLGEKSMAVCL